MLRVTTAVSRKPEVGRGEQLRREFWRICLRGCSSESDILPPAFGPTTAWDGAPAPAPPPPSAPPGLRIAPGTSPSCGRPSSAALLPSTPPHSPLPPPAAQPLPQSGRLGRAQTPKPFGVTRRARCCKMDTEGSAGAGCALSP